MELKRELAKYRDLMWKRAQVVFEEQKHRHAGMGAFIEEFLDQMHDAIQGGKAVRGALVCHGAKACGGEVNDDIIDLALAMELFHTYLLIHDDIIDRDTLRRGKPSFHTRYKEMESDLYEPDDPYHFGVSMGILAGDMLSAIAYQLICGTKLDPEIKIAITQAVSETLFETGAGEILDVLNDIHFVHDREHLLKVHTLKTARYTFYSPLRIGAHAVKASKEQHDCLKEYALPIGIAYQLHDDLLGLFGEASKIGKPVFSDLREGKQTLLIMEAYERATDQQRRAIDLALGNPDITIEQGEDVKRIVRDTGAHHYSLQLANTFKEESMKALKTKHLSDESKLFFSHLAEYIVNRDY